MVEEKNCPICGNPTRKYMGNYRKDNLCGNHADMLKSGFLKFENNNWYSKTTANEWKMILPKKEETTNNKCLICNEKNANVFMETNEIKGIYLCKNCRDKAVSLLSQIDFNQKSYEIKDYYYNLRASIYRLDNYDLILNQTTKLITLAYINQIYKKDTTLTFNLENDIKKILTTKRKIIDNKETTISQQKDNTIISTSNFEKNRAQDGHLCKSDKEVIIDDLLYHSHICHAYSRRVKEIPNDIDRTITADWFIPLSGHDGIYIEYWGMDKLDYNDNKEEKMKLYEKYKNEVKLISIDKDEINDRQNLEDNLFQQLKKYGWKG